MGFGVKQQPEGHRFLTTGSSQKFPILKSDLKEVFCEGVQGRWRSMGRRRSYADEREQVGKAKFTIRLS